jgi:DNA-binding NtrC family response regulator
MRMPGMDGMDILRLVRQGSRTEKVIIITAFGSLESVSEAMSLGAFGYIVKPFKKEQLLGAVDEAVRAQRENNELNRIMEILDMEPVDRAVEAFRDVYLGRRGEAVSTRNREEQQ